MDCNTGAGQESINCRFRCPWVEGCSCVGSVDENPETCKTAEFLMAYWKTREQMHDEHERLRMQEKYGMESVGEQW